MMIRQDLDDGPAAAPVTGNAGPSLSAGGASAAQGDAGGDHDRLPAVSEAELAQLHVRVIALEALVAALLVDASDAQIGRVRAMAAYICPRPGTSAHPLTERAAGQMDVLLERARRFGGKDDSGQPPPADGQAS